MTKGGSVLGSSPGRRCTSPSSSAASPHSPKQSRAPLSPARRSAGSLAGSPRGSDGSPRLFPAAAAGRSKWRTWGDIGVGTAVEVSIREDRVPGVVIAVPAAEGQTYRIRLDNGKKCWAPRHRLTTLGARSLTDTMDRAQDPAPVPPSMFADGPVSPRVRQRRTSGPAFAVSLPAALLRRSDSGRWRGSASGMGGSGEDRRGSRASASTGTRTLSLSSLSSRISQRRSSRRPSVSAIPTVNMSVIAGHRPSLVSQRRASGKDIVDVKREVVVRAPKTGDFQTTFGTRLDGLRVLAVDKGGAAHRARLPKLMSLAPDHTMAVAFNGAPVSEVEELLLFFDQEQRGDEVSVTFQAPVMIFIPSLFDDDDNSAGNCNNKFQGVEDLKWYHALDAFGRTRSRFNSLHSPLGIVSRTGALRRRLVWIVDSKEFDRTVLAIIFANAVCLAMNIPSTEDNDGIQDFLTISEYVFLGAFTLEAGLKICAMGFVSHVDSYLRSSVGGDTPESSDKACEVQQRRQAPMSGAVRGDRFTARWVWNWWNIIDFLIVLVGWAGLNRSVTNVSVVRAVRVLRPLRALHRVQGLQMILRALLSALNPLANVMIMLMFFMIVFVIVGVLFWGGKWHQRCVLDAAAFLPPVGTASAADVAIAQHLNVTWGGGAPAEFPSGGWEQAEWLLANVSNACAGGSFGYHCNHHDTEFFGPSSCEITDWRRSKYLNFDNSLTATLLVFKIISLDDWPDDLQIAQDTTGQFAFLYFLALTLFGSYFTMNLVLATLCGDFSLQRVRLKKQRMEQKLRKQKGERFKTYSFPVKCSTVHFTYLRLAIAVYGSRTAMWRPFEPKGEDERSKSLARRVLDMFMLTSPVLSPGAPCSESPLVSPVALPSPGRTEEPVALPSPGRTEEPVVESDEGDLPGGDQTARQSELLVSVRPDDLVASHRVVGAPMEDSGPSPPATGSHRASQSPPGSGGHRASQSPPGDFSRTETGGSARGSDADAAPNGAAVLRPAAAAALEGSRRKSSLLRRRRRSNATTRRPAMLSARDLSVPNGGGRGGGEIFELVGVESGESDEEYEYDDNGVSRVEPIQRMERSSIEWFPRRGSVINPGTRTFEAPSRYEPADSGAADADPEHFAESFMTLDVSASMVTVIGAAIAASHTGVQSSHWWNAMRIRVRKFVESRAFRYFISFVIAFNIVVMCLDRHEIDGTTELLVEYTSLVCNVIYVIEMLLKWLGLGFWHRKSTGETGGYFASAWNWFDCILVGIGTPEMVISLSAGSSDSGSGLTALRAFRAFRVTRVLRRFKSLEVILKLIRVSVASAAYLVIIMLLFVFIYTILGVQLFSDSFPTSERNNFSSLWQACITVFVVITGEGWATTMEVAMEHTSPAACIFFITLFCLGNYIFTNLFIAILIDKFAGFQVNASGQLQPKQSKNSDMQESGVDQVVMEGTEATTDAGSARDTPLSLSLSPTNEPFGSETSVLVASGGESLQGAVVRPDATAAVVLAAACASLFTESLPSELLQMSCADWDADSESDVDAAPEVEPVLTGTSLLLFSPTNRFRVALSRIVFHRAFDYVVVAVIALNTVTMSLSGPWLRRRPTLERVVEVAEHIFVGLFVAEAVVKIIVLGFIGDCRKKAESTVKEEVRSDSGSSATSDGIAKSEDENEAAAVLDGDGMDVLTDDGLEMHVELTRPYLRTLLNRVDFFVCLTAVLGIAFEFFFIFRSLRTVRLIVRSKNIKVVVQALLHALPGIANVLVVTCFAFLVFAILGVQLFKGKLHYCTDPEVEFRVNCTGSFVPTRCGRDGMRSKEVCGDLQYCEWRHGQCVPSVGVGADIWGDPADYAPVRREWINSRFNYDDVGESFISLFTVAVGERWADMMWLAVDARGSELSVLHSNSENSNPEHTLYFIAFYFVGNFFALNLFVGLLIDQFARKKKLQDRKKFGSWSSVFITDEQHYWIAASKTLKRISLTPRLVEPAGDRWYHRARQWAFATVMHPWFDKFVVMCIVANAVILSLRHWNQSERMDYLQDTSNFIFLIIFAVEAALKIAAWDASYFTDRFNLFDFLLVLLSVVGRLVGSSAVAVVRIMRVGRVVRLVRTKRLSELFLTLWHSLPSLLNIGMFLVMIYFNFAVMGVQLFGDVGSDRMSKWLNFENVGNAMLLLYTLSSTELWTDVYIGTYARTHQCDDTGDCGVSRSVSVAFFLTFVVLCALVTINLFITVVLDNFVPGDEDDSWLGTDGILQKLQRFTTLWSHKDPAATGMLSAEAFIELLESEELQAPVRLEPRAGESMCDRSARIARHLLALAMPNENRDFVYIPVNRKVTEDGRRVNQVRYWDCLVAIARRYSRVETQRRMKVGVYVREQHLHLEEQLDWLIHNVLLRGAKKHIGRIGGPSTLFTVFHWHAATRIKQNWALLRLLKRPAAAALAAGVAVLTAAAADRNPKFAAVSMAAVTASAALSSVQTDFDETGTQFSPAHSAFGRR